MHNSKNIFQFVNHVWLRIKVALNQSKLLTEDQKSQYFKKGVWNGISLLAISNTFLPFIVTSLACHADWQFKMFIAETVE